MDRVIDRMRQLEGRQVNVALADGSRFDAAALVSAGRGATSTLWVFTGGADVFVPTAEVRDVWEDQYPRFTAA